MTDSNRCFALLVALPLLLLAMPGWARAATFTVTNTLDSGGGSLRDAITSANAVPTVPNTINFSVSGTITLGSTLPPIANSSTGSLTIDGSGQAIAVDGANTFQILSVNAGATLILRNLTITHGNSQSVPQGEHGGGVENGGTLTVTTCTFSNNTAGLGGGAIDNRATLTVTNSTFSGNSAPIAGGIDNFGTLTVTNSTFSGNIADNGGGIANDATLTLINCTFSGNSALIGAGLENEAGTLTVTNCTFSGNVSTGTGGGIFNNSGVTTLKSTILASEPSGGNCSGTGTPPVTDAGFNISDDGSCNFSGTSVNNSTTLNLDPAGLANNGGPTNTIALEPNSQAIDFIPIASCTDQSSPTPLPVTTDQRGFPRPDPGNPLFCDAGAFELQTTPIVVEPNSERLQIARSAIPDSDKLNMAFTFTENGFPACDAGDDAFNGIAVILEDGTCATHDHAAVVMIFEPWVVHTVNHESYGTFFGTEGPTSLAARMVALPTPAAPACGEWTINIELAGGNTGPLGNGPFALILDNPDGDVGCFDITNAIVGTQLDPPRKVRRGARRGRR